MAVSTWRPPWPGWHPSAGQATVGPAFVQLVGTAHANAFTVTLTVPTGHGLTAGHTAVVVAAGDYTNHLTQVSDSTGAQTWVIDAQKATNGNVVAIAHALLVDSIPAGDTIVCQFHTTGTAVRPNRFCVLEYSGVLSVSPLDAHGVNTATSISVTPTVAGCLLVAGFAEEATSATLSPAAPFTRRWSLAVSASYATAVDYISPTTTPKTATWAAAAGTLPRSAICAYKPA